MKRSILKTCTLLAMFPVLAWTQTGPTPTTTPKVRPIKGVQELTFSGSGGSNRHFNDSFGGASASYGVYYNNEWQGVLRQSVNYHNPDGGSTTWSGSTRAGADYHVTTLGKYMPFFGASFGRIYGSAVRDTWSAGLEAGLKYYTQRKLFVFAMAEYSWLFKRARELDNNFGDGQITFSTGIGFNF
ncbi:MAG: hypothetical protein ACREH8_00655 [Opitutaceae bacterium]